MLHYWDCWTGVSVVDMEFQFGVAYSKRVLVSAVSHMMLNPLNNLCPDQRRPAHFSAR